MGHLGGSVQARYSHITAEMRCRFLEGLTDLWNAALDQRRRCSVGALVGVLDALLRWGRLGGDDDVVGVAQQGNQDVPAFKRAGRIK